MPEQQSESSPALEGLPSGMQAGVPHRSVEGSKFPEQQSEPSPAVDCEPSGIQAAAPHRPVEASKLPEQQSDPSPAIDWLPSETQLPASAVFEIDPEVVPVLPDEPPLELVVELLVSAVDPLVVPDIVLAFPELEEVEAPDVLVVDTEPPAWFMAVALAVAPQPTGSLVTTAVIWR